MLLRKITLAVLVLVFSTELVLADNGYRRKSNRKHNYNNSQVERHHRPRNNKNYHRRGNNYQKGNNNYYRRGNNYYNYNYNYKNKNQNFYNDPYFWGGVAGGLIGGAIIGNQYYDGPECETIWVEVFVPGEGYRNMQQVVCN